MTLKNKMTFRYFQVDGVNYACDKNGCPAVKQRKKVRKGVYNEVLVEEQYLLKVKRSNIDIKSTEAYKWLTELLGKPVWNDTTAIGRFFSLIFNIEMPREAYRRANTTLYWFNEHWNTIVAGLRKHKVAAMHSKKGMISFTAPCVAPPVIIVCPMKINII